MFILRIELIGYLNCEPVEEDEAGHLLYAVFVGKLAVGRLDEVDVLAVGVVVNVL